MKQRILFAFLMALINASFISFVLTAYNLGFQDDFLLRWLINFMIAGGIVIPSVLFVSPFVQKLSKKLAGE